ncbi:uncharacterized protein SPSK_05813 [Sporothrix schenckii 1099-18]|uniref:Uncharacterized protein n=1 Tax=Sporothrix schenckii 1099-18 TaxID=1397361 RepID=A0A0F2MK29_SPOSC|nr:uncharacterized protein SPSK_05813 [Sporothrix schenckii 1099-18]KJR89195.1 hypothetical protein SPSK_05813 [Sporothrix schenckii 1099-18]
MAQKWKRKLRATTLLLLLLVAVHVNEVLGLVRLLGHLGQRLVVTAHVAHGPEHAVLVLHQLPWVAVLDERATVQHQHLVVVGNRLQTVRNRHNRRRQLAERLLDLGVRRVVDRRGRLVHQQDRRVLEQRPRKTQQLALALRQVRARLGHGRRQVQEDVLVGRNRRRGRRRLLRRRGGSHRLRGRVRRRRRRQRRGAGTRRNRLVGTNQLHAAESSENLLVRERLEGVQVGADGAHEQRRLLGHDDLARLGLKGAEQSQRKRTLTSTSAADNANLLVRSNAEGQVAQHGVQLGAVPGGVVNKLHGALARPVGGRTAVFNHGRRLLLDVEVLLNPLHRVHVLLVHGIQTHKPQHVLGKTNGVAERDARRTGINGTKAQNDKHACEESNEIAQEICAECQPAVSCPQVDKRSDLRVDTRQVVTDKAALVAIRADGCDTRERLAKLLEQRTALDRLKTLQNDVECRDENTGNQEAGSYGRNQDYGNADGEGTRHDANGHRGHLLVDSLEILAEAIHHLAERGHVEELEAGKRHRMHQAVVQFPGRSQGTEEDPEIADEGKDSTDKTNDSQDGNVVVRVDLGCHEGLEGRVGLEDGRVLGDPQRPNRRDVAHGVWREDVREGAGEQRRLAGGARDERAKRRVEVRRSHGCHFDGLLSVLVRPLLDPQVGGDERELLGREDAGSNNPEPPRPHGTKVQLNNRPLDGACSLGLLESILLFVYFVLLRTGGTGSSGTGGAVTITGQRRIRSTTVVNECGAVTVISLFADARGHARRDTRDVGSACCRLELDLLTEHARGNDLLGRALASDAAIVHDDNKVGEGDTERDVVRDQNASAVAHERAANAVVEDPLCRVRVDGAQAVVQEQVTGVGVQSTGKRDTLLLATGQGNALLSDQGLVTVVQCLVQITLQGAGHNDVAVPLLVKRRREENVLLDGSVHEPGLLGDVGARLRQIGLRVGADILTTAAAREVHLAVYESHFAEQSHEQRGLAGTGGASDNVELANIEVHIQVEKAEGHGAVLGNHVLATPYEAGVVAETNDAFAGGFVDVVQAELVELLGLLLRQKLLDTVNGDLGLLNVGNHVAELVERVPQQHEQGDGSEGDRRVQGLVLDHGVDQEAAECNQDGDRVPHSDCACPDNVTLTKGLKLGAALLVDNVAEAELPGEVLDDADILENLVGGVDALVGSGHNLLLGGVESLGEANVDRQEQRHDDEARDGTQAHDTVQQDNGDEELGRSSSNQEMQVGCDLGHLEAVNRHEVDDGTNVGLLIRLVVVFLRIVASSGRGIRVVGSRSRAVRNTTGSTALVGLLESKLALDRGHPAGLLCAGLVRLVRLATEHGVVARGGLAAESLGVDLAHKNGANVDADLATNPEGLVVAERADQVGDGQEDDVEPQNIERGLVGVLDKLQDGLEQHGRGKGKETRHDGPAGLDKQRALKVQQQVDAQRQGLLYLPVARQNGTSLVLGIQIPNALHLQRLLVTLPHNAVDPGEGESRLVALAGGDGHGEEQRRQGELDNHEDLGKGRGWVDEDGAEDGEREKPLRRVDHDGMVPQAQVDEEGRIDPGKKANNGGRAALGNKNIIVVGFVSGKGALGEGNDVHGNEAGNGQLLDDNQKSLAGRPVGLHNGALGGGAGQVNGTATDHEAVIGVLVAIVVVIVVGHRRTATVRRSTVALVVAVERAWSGKLRAACGGRLAVESLAHTLVAETGLWLPPF